MSEVNGFGSSTSEMLKNRYLNSCLPKDAEEFRNMTVEKQQKVLNIFKQGMEESSSSENKNISSSLSGGANSANSENSGLAIDRTGGGKILLLKVIKAA